MKKLLFLCFIILHNFNFFTSSAQNPIKVSDFGWRLWPDTIAQWKNDKLFLPGEFDIKSLPINEPSAGWDYLNNRNGIEITLPSTVEEHFWGLQGFRNYSGNYNYGSSDNQVKDGSYKGVSWWWTYIDIPQSIAGKKVLLKIRAARFRAEVFINRQLVGYDLVSETSFDCDISKAIIPGKKNMLAIRITNPGGQLDWVDFNYMNWGNYELHSSHGFGGLDRGITIEAHDPVFISDLWVLNHPDLTQVSAYCKFINTTMSEINGTINLQIIDSKNKLIKEFRNLECNIPSDTTLVSKFSLQLDKAKPWSVENPFLYKIKAILTVKQNFTDRKEIKYIDERSRIFGFRWFDSQGIGTDAMLMFNHNRIRLTSAISWGFWGLNGIFPTKELAEKEVLAAKRLGLNCLQFHRNTGKTDVLDYQDKIGLLRYMEPGGGVTALGKQRQSSRSGRSNLPDTTGKNGEASTFAEKYLEEKIVRMVQDHRSHPSLLMYVIQNEMITSLSNPRVWYLMKRMQAEDPSRIIALHSGIETSNQVLIQPYSPLMLFDKGNGFSGWFDKHTVGGPGTWKDELYLNEDNFTHRSKTKEEIMIWGEMLGAAAPDNHETMVSVINKNNGKSYDYVDHKELLNVYNKFLDKWNFRTSFPTAGALFDEIGSKSYDFWGRVIETAKLSNDNDYLVISGWESTAIENHSGLVDNLRQYKSDPNLISERLAPLRPVVKFQSMVLESGKRATMDIFLINETGKQVKNRLNLTLYYPDGKTANLGAYEIPPFEKTIFAYKIASQILSEPLTAGGKYKVQLSLDSEPKITSDDEFLVIDPIPGNNLNKRRVALVGNHQLFEKCLKDEFGMEVSAFKPGEKYDLIILTHSVNSINIAKTTNPVENTLDDPLYQSEICGKSDNMDLFFPDIPKGKVTVTLKFVESFFNSPKMRIFDVAINGKVVLDDFDVFAEAGKFRALDKTITAENTEGYILISFPEIKRDVAKINAVKIETPGKLIACNLGGDKYTDKNGLDWLPYIPLLSFDSNNTTPLKGNDTLTGLVFNEVTKGTPMLILPQNEGAVNAYCTLFQNYRLIDCSGSVGRARQSWMGSWVFIKENKIYNGLPVNCVMNSYYQVGANDADGLLLNSSDVEVLAGYSRDHDRNVGATSFIAPVGKGRILFHALYVIIPAAEGSDKMMQPVVAKRLLYNSIDYLLQNK